MSKSSRFFFLALLLYELNWSKTKTTINGFQLLHSDHQIHLTNIQSSKHASHFHRKQLCVYGRTTTAVNLIPIDTIPDITISVVDHLHAFTSSTIMTQSLATTASSFSMDKDSAEALAGPFFGLSLFPYLAFIYFLNIDENQCPKGVVVGFAACLLFVFLTIPAAIAAKILYNESLANCDWLHGSAESMLTITNLATVVPFRQAFNTAKGTSEIPISTTTYQPTAKLVGLLTFVAIATAIVPAISNPAVHTPYLFGFMDLPPLTIQQLSLGTANPEPENALTVATWIIHVSSLVEFLVVMGYCWRWADVVKNPTWKGLTWGLLPLHTSGITACVSHLFYNQIPVLVPLQAILTCIGNSTAAYAAFRIALSNGWKPPIDGFRLPSSLQQMVFDAAPINDLDSSNQQKVETQSLLGFEDLGDALANDSDVVFLIKLFVGCAMFSYIIKYGEIFFNFPFEASLPLSIAIIAIPSALNAFKWYRRSQDPSFDGWF